MHINHPTDEQIQSIKAEGYRIESYENTGMGDMEFCDEGTYCDPDFMELDEETKVATLYFL